MTGANLTAQLSFIIMRSSDKKQSNPKRPWKKAKGLINPSSLKFYLLPSFILLKIITKIITKRNLPTTNVTASVQAGKISLHNTGQNRKILKI
ncbi:hypothetical protein D3C76_1360150 [compost metagenome]